MHRVRANISVTITLVLQMSLALFCLPKLHPYPHPSRGPKYTMTRVEETPRRSPTGTRLDRVYRIPFWVNAKTARQPFGTLVVLTETVKPYQIVMKQ